MATLAGPRCPPLVEPGAGSYQVGRRGRLAACCVLVAALVARIPSIMRRPSMWTASALAGLVAAACNAHDARASSVTRHYSPLLTPLQRNAGTPELFPMPPCKGGFLLHEATIDQMQEAMNNDSLTAVDLVKCYRARTLQTQPYIKLVTCRETCSVPVSPWRV